MGVSNTKGGSKLHAQKTSVIIMRHASPLTCKVKRFMPNGISQLLNLTYSKTCLTADFPRFIAQYGWTTVSLSSVSYETCLTADFKSSPWQSASCLRAKCVCMCFFVINIVFMPDDRALLVLCVGNHAHSVGRGFNSKCN